MLTHYNDLTKDGRQDAQNYFKNHSFGDIPIQEYYFHTTKAGRINKAYKWPAVHQSYVAKPTYEQLQNALYEVLQYAVGNRGSKSCNPYTNPAVMFALTDLAQSHGQPGENWIEALVIHQRTKAKS